MKDVLLIGEIMTLFYAEEFGSFDEITTFTKGIAGAEVNVGTGLSRLGHTVNFITRLSNDDFGKYIYKYLETEQIGTDYITYDAHHRTGMMLKNKVEYGDPETIYYRDNSAASRLSVEHIHAIDFSKIKLVHITGIPLALSASMQSACRYVVKRAKEAGCIITFDPNLRPAIWQSMDEMIKVINEFASYADIVMPGISEAEVLIGSRSFEEIERFYLRGCTHTIIVKCGGDGAYVIQKDGENFMQPGFKVDKIIDTVGAGDGFAVGVISSLLEGLSIHKMVERANAIGAIQLHHQGDNEGLPTQEVLRKFIEEKKE